MTTSTTRKSNNKRVADCQAIVINGGEAVPVQMLLDNGSQLSYVTTSLQSRQERLYLNTFGSKTFTTKGCDVVKLLLQRPGHLETIELTARTSPVVCSGLPTLIDVSKHVCSS